MSLIQIIFEALESLNANKMRSGLTILGIVIGVGAVIAMLGIGQGAQNSITGTINGIGTNLLFVFPGNQQIKLRNIRHLTMQDAQALSDPFLTPHVIVIAPLISGQRISVAANGEETTTELDGITPEYSKMLNYKVAEGEYISQDHVLGRASVVLLGAEVADKLFDRHDGLVGEIVRIEGQPFRVIGVMEKKGGSAFGSQDNFVFIPITTARIRIVQRPGDRVDAIMAQASSSEDVGLATEEITSVLRTRHRTALGEDDFTVFSQADFLSAVATITGVLTYFLGGIAAISLLVGGIGIMNIMLVSVAERTREIGLRKAVGARKRDILVQFLAESSMLSLIGGIVGILLGWLICFAIGKIAAANNVVFEPSISLNAILLATIFSAAVGLFFGIYPANRAASLQPVEALRYE